MSTAKIAGLLPPPRASSAAAGPIPTQQVRQKPDLAFLKMPLDTSVVTNTSAVSRRTKFFNRLFKLQTLITGGAAAAFGGAAGAQMSSRIEGVAAATVTAGAALGYFFIMWGLIDYFHPVKAAIPRTLRPTSQQALPASSNGNQPTLISQVPKPA